MKDFSRRTYVQLKRKDIAFFKFLLESRDNLAYLTVIDKYKAVVQVVYGFGFEREIKEFLSDAGQEIFLKIVFMDREQGKLN
jgi:hypothetical protein